MLSGTSTSSATRSEVSIEIFNIRGQLVRGLVSGVWDQGFHSVEWNGLDDFGRPVESGVYLFILTADNVREVRRMVLIK